MPIGGYLGKSGRNVARVVKGKAQGGPLGGRKKPQNMPPDATIDDNGQTHKIPEATTAPKPAAAPKPAGPDNRIFDYRTNRYVDPDGNTSPDQSPQARPVKVDSLVPAGTFADTTGVPAQIMDLRQRALGGFSDPERVGRREQFLSGIEGTRAGAANDLARRQRSSGTTGGIAFAQQQQVSDAALQARAGAERDLFLENEVQRRQALNDLQSYTGGERYGNLATQLAQRQLNIQAQGQAQTGRYQQQIIDALNARGTGTLPADDRQGPDWAGPNWSSQMAQAGYPIPAGSPQAYSPNSQSPYTRSYYNSPDTIPVYNNNAGSTTYG